MMLNPILYHFHVLHQWLPGDDTNTTQFKNGIDFYTSFGIGISLAIAVIGFRSLLKLRRTPAEKLAAAKGPPSIPPGRGDIPNGWVLACYLISTVIYILVCGYLVDWHRGVMVILIFFGFVYTPIISFVTARLIGMNGTSVDIPYISQLAFILSGFKGIDIWFIPLPMSNYGGQTMMYRTAELTGTRFPSMWKADILLFPIVIVASLCFASFIWSIAEIPSSVYPFANKMWELNAKNAVVVYSSTRSTRSSRKALSVVKIIVGFVVGTVLFSVLGFFKLPIMFMYGVIGGFGSTMHGFILTFTGGLFGRYYMQKKLGLKWMEYAPVVCSGYFCGAGMAMMFAIGLVFLKKSKTTLAY